MEVESYVPSEVFAADVAREARASRAPPDGMSNETDRALLGSDLFSRCRSPPSSSPPPPSGAGNGLAVAVASASASAAVSGGETATEAAAAEVASPPEAVAAAGETPSSASAASMRSLQSESGNALGGGKVSDCAREAGTADKQTIAGVDMIARRGGGGGGLLGVRVEGSIEVRVERRLVDRLCSCILDTGRK